MLACIHVRAHADQYECCRDFVLTFCAGCRSMGFLWGFCMRGCFLPCFVSAACPLLLLCGTPLIRSPYEPYRKAKFVRTTAAKLKAYLDKESKELEKITMKEKKAIETFLEAQAKARQGVMQSPQPLAMTRRPAQQAWE